MKNKKLVILAVQPTPYNYYFFQQLKTIEYVDTEIFYVTKKLSHAPWQTKLVNDDDKFFNSKFFLDFNLLKRALLEKNTKFFISGWNNPTKFLILFFRSLLGYEIAFWTDAVKPTQKIYKQKLINLLMSNVNPIFTTGEIGIKKFIENGYARHPKHLLNLPYFVEIPSDYTIKEKNKNDQINFLCIGQLIERKGFEYVLKAIKIILERGVTNFQVNIVGLGPLEHQLKKYTEDNGLKEFVTFLGWLEPNEVNSTFKKHDIFIHPVSQHDPYPLVVLEAMSHGLPIIGSSLACSAADRVIPNKNGFIVPPKNASAIAKYMELFIVSSERIKQFSLESRKTAENWNANVGVQLVADKYINR